MGQREEGDVEIYEERKPKNRNELLKVFSLEKTSVLS